MHELIKRIEVAITEFHSNDATGHDTAHVLQVRDLALRIGRIEGGDQSIIEIAALVHDVGDRKIHDSEVMGITAVRTLLAQCLTPHEIVEVIIDIVSRVSFKGAEVPDDMPTLEGKIVQDADRITALGAVGIARTFAYGGAKGRPICDPAIEVEYSNSAEEYYARRASTINHFYEKLLLLFGRLHTATAREIAAPRHKFLEQFLDEFWREWKGEI